MKNSIKILALLFSVFVLSINSYGQATEKKADYYGYHGKKYDSKAKAMAPRFYVTSVNLTCGGSTSDYRKCTNPNIITLESGAGFSVFQNEGMIVRDNNGTEIANIKGIKKSPYTSSCVNLNVGQTYTIEVVDSNGGVYPNPSNGNLYAFKVTAKDCSLKAAPANINDANIKAFSKTCEPPCPSGKNCVDGSCQ